MKTLRNIIFTLFKQITSASPVNFFELQRADCRGWCCLLWFLLAKA
jgi:hypothetical protein